VLVAHRHHQGIHNIRGKFLPGPQGSFHGQTPAMDHVELALFVMGNGQ
jgi:hypothetical protein